jgi:hypothetical protein
MRDSAPRLIAGELLLANDLTGGAGEVQQRERRGR